MIHWQQTKKLCAGRFTYSVQLTFILSKLLIAFVNLTMRGKTTVVFLEGLSEQKIERPRDSMLKSDPVEVKLTLTGVFIVMWFVPPSLNAR